MDERLGRDSTVTLTLPFPGRGLSPNSRLPWRAKAAAVAEYRETVGWIAKEARQMLQAPLEPPVRAEVVFTLPDRRRRDPDNCQAMLKAAWDGMVDAGLLQDDRVGMLEIEKPTFVQGEKPGSVLVTLRTGASDGWSVGSVLAMARPRRTYRGQVGGTGAGAAGARSRSSALSTGTSTEGGDRQWLNR